MNANVKLLLQRWLIDEPALYRILCTHEVYENKMIRCNVRCGGGKIEYNPDRLSGMSYTKVNELFRAEAIRIILKHPYERQPDCCNKTSSLIGSNLVLGDNYSFNEITMPIPSDYGFEKGLSYEQYSFQIQDIYDEINSLSSGSSHNEDDFSGSKDSLESNETPDSKKEYEVNEDGESKESAGNAAESRSCEKIEQDSNLEANSSKEKNGSNNESECDENSDSLKEGLGQTQSNHKSSSEETDQSELWDEDPLMQCAVNNAIEEIKSSGCSWGSVSANHIEQILASTKAKIDYRKVLAGFRSTILSSKRHLTRMRPNRRSGFDNMGSIRRYDTKLLVGVDVSASVKSESLRHFFSIISRLFKYGIEKVDVIQFDCSIKDISSFEKAEKTINIVGRGGTDFQPVIDYASENQYDGLIMFTDGYASTPNIKQLRGCKIAWVCDCEKNFKANSEWMKKQGRCCFVEV